MAAKKKPVTASKPSTKSTASGAKKQTSTRKPAANRTAATKKTTAGAAKRPPAKRPPAASRAAKNSAIKTEAMCLLFSCVGLLLAISIYTSDTDGVLAKFVNSFLLGMFGLGAYVLPFVIIAVCLVVLFSVEKRMEISKLTMCVWLFIIFVSFFSVMYYGSADAVFNHISYLTDAYKAGGFTNGGLFGAVFGGLLLKCLGKLGAQLVLIFLFVALMIMVSGKSLVDMISSIYERISGGISDLRDNYTYRDEDEDDYYDEYDEEYFEDDEYYNDGYYEEEYYDDRLIPIEKGQALRDRKKAQIFNHVIEAEGEEENDDHSLELINSTQRKPKPKATKQSRNIIFKDETPSRIRMLNIGTDEEEASAAADYEDGDDYADTARDELDARESFEPIIHTPEPSAARHIDDEDEPLFARPLKVEREAEYIPAPKPKVAYTPKAVPIEEDMPPFDLDEADINITGTGVEGYVAKAIDAVSETVIDGRVSEAEEAPVAHHEYIFPPVELLKENNYTPSLSSKAQILENSRKLEETLKSFGVEARVVEVSKGPSVTRYELSPGQGVKVSKISGLADDLALNLAANGIRIEAPIPGKSVVGIEIPNKEVQSVYLREVIDDEAFWNYSSKLSFALGKDIAGNIVITDIAKMPHLLIAGATGSGKSVCINTLITSILYKSRPDEVKLLMIDPKVVELSIYNGIPHLHIPVVTEPKKAAGALNWGVREMDQRYNLFAETHTRDLKGYNATLVEQGLNPLPQIVIIIDELADLMMTCGKEVEESICRLAQKARAAGIHLIIATQRPSVDVITGLIKANVPSRLAFAVSSGTDSRTILDMVGAEKLLGKGDMLFSPVGLNKPQRIQCSFISDKEVENIVNFIKANNGEAVYDESLIQSVTSNEATAEAPDEGEDEFTNDAISFIVDKGRASVSMLQRRFRIGYNRAARLMENLENRGIVGPEDGSKPREVLMSKYQWEEYRERNGI